MKLPLALVGVRQIFFAHMIRFAEEWGGKKENWQQQE
jgi:hypothetical protein